MPPQDPTADYRKYPKGQPFGVIVALSAFTILVVIALGIFFIHERGKHMPAHKPDLTPNSLLSRPAGTSAA